MSTRFLTELEVAERTHISLDTLRRWRLESKGPRFHKFGSLVRYNEDELVEWERSQPCGGGGVIDRMSVQSVKPGILMRKSG